MAPPCAQVVLCMKPGGDQGGAGSPGRRQDGGSVPAEPPAAPETAVDCSLSQPLVPADLEGPWHGSLGLGSVSEPERSPGGGGGAGRDRIPGRVLTPGLVSRPRGAVLHVNGRAERRSGPWGCLQSDRPFQVSPAHGTAWAPAVCQGSSPPLPSFPLCHPLGGGGWVSLIAPFFRREH